MNRFHVCKKVKSFLLIALSVAILVCSVPTFCFRSNAAEAYLVSNYLSAWYTISSYLLSRGYSAPKLAGADTSVDSYSYSGIQVQNFIDSFVARLNAWGEEHSGTVHSTFVGSDFLAQVAQAQKTGKLNISDGLDADIRAYLYDQTASGTVVVGSTYTTYEPINAHAPIFFSAQYTNSDSPNVFRSVSFQIDCPYDCLPVANYFYDSTGSLTRITILLLPLVAIYGNDQTTAYNQTSCTVSKDSTSYVEEPNKGSAFLNNNSNYFYVSYNFNFNDPRFNLSSISSILGAGSVILSLYSATTAALTSVMSQLRSFGKYDSELEYTSDQIADTSDLDLLSIGTEVDPITGEVTGNTTIYIPDYSSLEETIRDFSNSVISYISVLKTLGLSSVASDATVQEKESAQDAVAIPDSTYKWITDTTWGSTTVNETVTNEITQSQTQESSIAEELAEQYSNSPEGPQEDEENKGGLAMLIATALLYLGLWNDPSTDPTDPDSGGIVGDPEDEDTVPWLVDTLTAIPVVSAILGDVFDAAGGTNAYGFVYTVGISFVLFSVIIGAGHFFGALGSEIQARSQENDIKADHEYNKQQAYKAYREGLISKRELYRMTRK